MAERKLIQEETAGDLEGDFIELTEGLTIKGVLERAFCTEGQFGLQGAYGVRGTWAIGADTMTTEPTMILFGERPFFADALRDMKLGTYIELTFTEKAKYGKGDREMWKGKLLSDRAGKGKRCTDEMNDYFRRRILPTRATKKSEETPF